MCACVRWRADRSWKWIRPTWPLRCAGRASTALRRTRTATSPISCCAKVRERCTQTALRTPWTRASRIVSAEPVCAITSIWRCRHGTNSTAGPPAATVLTTSPFPRVMYRATSSVTRTSMPMEAGATTRLTAMCGFRIASWPAGRLTATGTGPGSLPGAGPGWTTQHGDSRCRTMGAGPICAIAGPGYRGRSPRRPGTRRPWSCLWVAATSG